MSYPSLSSTVKFGLTKSGFKKTPHFQSLTQMTPGGRGRSSVSLQPYATWDFEVELVPTNPIVLQAFLGLYLQTCGGAGFWLFTDPNDNTVTTANGALLNVTPGAASPMGQLGDGISTQFQLARNIGGGIDVIQNANGVTLWSGIRTGIMGSLAATISSTGLVTFAVPPPNGVDIWWAGTFQYLCQFTEDTIKDLAAVNKNAGGLIWTASSIAFESVFI